MYESLSIPWMWYIINFILLLLLWKRMYVCAWACLVFVVQWCSNTNVCTYADMWLAILKLYPHLFIEAGSLSEPKSSKKRHPRFPVASIHVHVNRHTHTHINTHIHIHTHTYTENEKGSVVDFLHEKTALYNVLKYSEACSCLIC